jgi:hypothetical protein
LKLKINGKEWTVNYKKAIAGDRFGDSDHPDEEKPEIRICSKLKDRDMLDTEIHELLHANCPYLEEDTVGAVATSIAEFLWRRKYRRGSKVAEGKPHLNTVLNLASRNDIVDEVKFKEKAKELGLEVNT